MRLLWLTLSLLVFQLNGTYGIYGGSKNLNGIPYMVALKQIDHVPHCGGAIISENWILTAAHCSDPSNLDTVFRSHCLQNGHAKTIEMCDIYIERVFLHDDYLSAKTAFNDIALIKTEMPIEFHEYDRIQLNRVHDIVAESKRVSFSGYGIGSGNEKLKFGNDLNTASADVLPKDKCILREEADPEKELNGRFCLNADDSEAGSGDAGGPATIKDENGKLVLVGVISSSHKQKGSGNNSISGLFTDVKTYIPWIESVIMKNTGDLEDSLKKEIKPVEHFESTTELESEVNEDLDEILNIFI